MKNEWKESLAKKYIKEYKSKKVSKDLALRIYSTHLLGNNPELVLHGGGNTSVKSIKKKSQFMFGLTKPDLEIKVLVLRLGN